MAVNAMSNRDLLGPMQHPILQLLCSTEASYPIFTLATVPDSLCCRPWRLAGDVGADGSTRKRVP
jgi:hypothetical protein